MKMSSVHQLHLFMRLNSWEGHTRLVAISSTIVMHSHGHLVPNHEAAVVCF